MKKFSLKRNDILAMPYTIWMIGFIVIPLFFIAYYAFTTRDGAFTLQNIIAFF